MNDNNDNLKETAVEVELNTAVEVGVNVVTSVIVILVAYFLKGKIVK